MLFVSRLPYKLAVGVTLEEYEERSDKFNIRGYWEWVNGDVIIYELPSKPHETFIFTITQVLFRQCHPVFGTDAHIIGLNCPSLMFVISNKSLFFLRDDSEKEGDASFRPEKPQVRPPNGSDGKVPSFIGSELFRTKISYFHDFRASPGRISSSKWRILRVNHMFLKK